MVQKSFVEKIIGGVGSVPSLLFHTLFFIGSFALAGIGAVEWSTMLLVLTTLVSLEAIYLAIFIQMSVNRQAIELAEVSEDMEDIQEGIEEISQDVDEIQKDVDEIQEDVEGIQEDVEDIGEEVETEDSVEERHDVVLQKLTEDIHHILSAIEQLKKK
jgi:uncharacterized membrane protein